MEETIQSSQEYDKFTFWKGNRPIQNKRVEAMKASVEKYGMISPGICKQDSKGKYLIADGQSRFVACQLLNQPFRFVVMDDITMDEVIDGNIVQTKWDLNDFLGSYLARGKMEYVHVQTFLIKYKLPISLAISLLSGPVGGRAIEKFKKGEFKSKDTAKADEIGEALILLKDEVPCYKNTRFILALSKCLEVPGFDIMEFVDKSRKNRIRQCADWNGYLVEIDRIYNHGRRINRIELAHEVKKMEEEKTHLSRLERGKKHKDRK